MKKPVDSLFFLQSVSRSANGNQAVLQMKR